MATDLHAKMATLDPKIQALVTALVEWLLSLFGTTQAAPTATALHATVKDELKKCYPDCPDETCDCCCQIMDHALAILVSAHECCSKCRP